jgi:hypothetical protein
MESTDAPLPNTPDAGEASALSKERAPSATAAVLAASSTIPRTTQLQPNGLLVQLRRIIAALADTIVPTPVRQGWHFVFAAFSSKYPTKYRYSAPIVAVLVAVAEWQQPGFLPHTDKLTNAIVGFLCATLIVVGILVLQDYTENNRWPWAEEGWVWPWEAWLWSETAYDLGASTNTSAESDNSPLLPATPIIASTFASLTPNTPGSTPASSAQRDSLAMPPPTAFKQPFIIPPTPQLPRGLRPIHLSPPTPAQFHHSGLLGESPMPHKLVHFSGDYFHRNAQKLRAVSEWSIPGSQPLATIRKKMLSVGEDEVDFGDVGEGKIVDMHDINLPITLARSKTIYPWNTPGKAEANATGKQNEKDTGNDGEAEMRV